MNDLNSVLIEGNLTKNAVKTKVNETTLVSFTVGSNRYFKRNESDPEYQKEVSFFDVEVWGKLADSVVDKLNKGIGVRAVGRMKQDRWVDGAGQKRNRVKIIAEAVEFKSKFNKAPDEDHDEIEEPGQQN